MSTKLFFVRALRPLALLSFVFSFPIAAFAVTLDANALVQKARVFFSPNNQTVLEGSIFEVSIFLNTLGGSVNALDLTIKYPPDKLEIIRPSAGKSLIDVWIVPPFYSNTEGRAQFSGVVPNGIITSSSLVTTITFHAKATGVAPVSILSKSTVLANDGLGTEVRSEFGGATYTIVPRPPEGVHVTSDTHPYSSEWYNNNSPVVAWEKDAGVTDFSYILDTKPFTVPDNVSEGIAASVSYQNLADGLWYFHIKARKQDAWGPATHFLIHIDTTAPASFKPVSDVLIATGVGKVNRVLMTFFTTDASSGLDHYEVAVIDKGSTAPISPIFVYTESPYQLPDTVSEKSQVIVRAIDKAGNVRDVSVSVSRAPISWVKKYSTPLLVIFIVLLLVLLLTHYLYGHHIIPYLKRILKFVAAEKKLEDEKEKEVEALLDKQVETNIEEEKH